jgi:hypothetical protein
MFKQINNFYDQFNFSLLLRKHLNVLIMNLYLNIYFKNDKLKIQKKKSDLNSRVFY